MLTVKQHIHFATVKQHKHIELLRGHSEPEEWNEGLQMMCKHIVPDCPRALSHVLLSCMHMRCVATSALF